MFGTVLSCEELVEYLVECAKESPEFEQEFRRFRAILTDHLDGKITADEMMCKLKELDPEFPVPISMAH